MNRSSLQAIFCAALVASWLAACAPAVAPTSTVAPTQQPATAAPTAVPPTNTPAPTATVAPTNTAVPTNTVTPTATATATPTITPTNTATLTPAPTNTITPTSTLAPTAVPTQVPTSVPTSAAQPAATSPAPSGGKASVTVKNFRFGPNPLQVAVGTTVTWTNEDPFEHTVTGGVPPTANDTFDAGSLGEGRSFSFTFTKPGTYPYFCAIHTQMRGMVRVG